MFQYFSPDRTSAFIGSRCDLERLRALPAHVLLSICAYLDPFPELISIIQTLPLLTQYTKRDAPSWSWISGLRPGMTLFMTFDRAQGIEYVSRLDTIENDPGRSRPLLLGHELLVCQDHFGIRNLYSPADQLTPPPKNPDTLFYQRIPLREPPASSSSLDLFSDVSFP
ncbi:hypothetical protein A1O7_07655 [Cladophialophora yegresii CBS 114405]|uniref:F-box domain-containing protein n=1 Tax=Cladophialophora yegresii CBS 114405 TaxID=1182544 RepID=W9VP32_9EURO|nr:uncharacterized protein A1O7_07655 [Cladophialophora yegresii CBS 114405]EXJ57308.1 hypothetical protein A1O7_07655 [Cladophialophora yegresii CBS 114405]